MCLAGRSWASRLQTLACSEGGGNLNAALFLNNQVEFSVCLTCRYNVSAYHDYLLRLHHSFS